MNLFGRKRKPDRPRYISGSAARVPAKQNALRREAEILREEQPEALTAAGQRVLNGQATLLRRLIQPWQIRSFGYYDLLGEIKYASQFYSRSLANLQLYVAWRDDNGELIPVTLDPPEPLKEGEEGDEPEPHPWEEAAATVALDALDRIRDPGGGGRSGLLAAYGRLMFLVGETYLFVTENPETGLEQWEMLSTDEIRLNDGLYTRFKAPSLAATQFVPTADDQYRIVGVHPNGIEDTASEDDRAAAEAMGSPEAVAYRLWKRHPRFSDQADATMEGVLELCEELVLLTQAVRARARSRLAGSGILFLDERITTTPLEPTPDEDPQEDPFVGDLTEAMTAPIVDEGTASAVVPLVARVKVPEGMKLSDLVYHLQVIDPTQVYPETGLRLECIRRIAIGLDMPPEILEGFTAANHWSGWLIDEQSWKAHLQPVAQQLVEDLTSAYLTPYLKSEGANDWDRFCIAYDASAIINHPDRSKDAKDGYRDGVLGAKAYRSTIGFDEENAPTKEEHDEWVGIKLRDASIALTGEPSAAAAPPEEPDEEEAPGETPGAVVKGPPELDENPEAETVIGAARVGTVEARALLVEGAAHMALLRIREAAGAKIRTVTRRSGNEEHAALIDGVHGRDVASTLGSARVRALLGAGKETELVAAARDLVLDSLRMIGVADAAVAAAIAETIERHAARTLYEANPALNGAFTNYVKGLLSGATKER